MRDKFENIYMNNLWEHGSGEGSLPIHTKGYAKFVEHFLTIYNICSVVDLGCGDWQFSRFINWGDTTYHGYDIVQSVIDSNKAKFESDKTLFHLYTGDPINLPKADLIIAKDVLQHWSNNNIEKFLPLLSKYKYFLITNCINPNGKTVNINIEDGEFRFLDLRREPFSLQSEIVYEFTNKQNLVDKILFRKPRWHKISLSNACI